MIVTIVARTHMGQGACIGGITADGRSVRLIAPDREFNEHFNLEYRIGQMWEVEADRPNWIEPPHIENVIVRRKRLLGMAPDLPGFIERNMHVRRGSPEMLYGGLLQTTGEGTLYIARRTGVPECSTLFWRPDRPLIRTTEGKRIHYEYPADDGRRALVFVGFQEPIEEVPAGALVRVSLAHWWRPEDMPNRELRCYVQLSGWFLAQDHPATASRVPQTGDIPPSARKEEDMEAARAALKQVFGYDEFRPLQEPIIRNVLAGRDSLAVMPTGSGKSMCYQLPALLFPGLTVVVSPLISLMEDQVAQLREAGVSAAFLNSTLSYHAHVAASRQVTAGQIKLLYLAPETLLRPETLVLLENSRVDCLTIDEAHCISEWGHDFRPEYRQLAAVRQRLPGAVCLAVTATATERVRRDIRDSLGIPGAAEFVSTFDRANLLLSVAPRRNGLSQTLEFLEAHRGSSGIIYCATRQRVNRLSEQLNAHGWPALPYHAGLDTATRLANQRRFTHDEAQIIVATVAFGMGIDKSNVRFILHYDLPKDLESYYQQIGRAGRDGLPADCLLLFSRADAVTIQRLIAESDPTQQPGAAARLQAMLAYAETDDCRRRPLLTYFGEQEVPERCGRCDNCRTEAKETVDLTVPAQKFLSCVKRTGEIFGAGHVINVLRGSHARGVLARGHERLSTYGIGDEYNHAQWQQLSRQFVQKGLLALNMDHGGLRLTDKGWSVLRGESFHGTPPEVDRKVLSANVPVQYDPTLFELLRGKRQELARAAGVPPYFIFHDTTLAEMAACYPQTLQSLRHIQGVGETKLERYGEAFLEIIRPYCRERGIAEKPKPGAMSLPASAPVSARRTAIRRDVVVDLYRQGRSPAEIADTFGLKLQTVLNHLWEAIREGATVGHERLLDSSRLPDDMRERVLRAFAEHGADRLRPIYEAMDEAVSWEELHLLRLYYVITALESARP